MTNLQLDTKTNFSDTKKSIFNVKPVKHNGLVLQVNHTALHDQKQLRFVHASFNKYGNLIAIGDQAGNVFIIDIIQNKFWRLPKCYLSSLVKFSHYGNSVDVIIGNTSGKIDIVNVETGEQEGELIGHTCAVKDATFACDRICLTVSEREGVLWDLKNYGKLQVLSMVNDSNNLKFAAFIPVTNNILACFDDDTITVWKYGTYEALKQILPSSCNKQILKSITFTRNGQAMVFGGHSSQLTVFKLDTWEIINVITLPESILSVKKIEFLPHLFDGGSNRTLIILSGHGIIYFYDMEHMLITSQISTGEEITKFDTSPDGMHLSCVLRSGTINIYKIAQYLQSYKKISTVSQENHTKTRHNLLNVRSDVVTAVRKQIKEVLDTDKLHSILKEFGEYPDAYRLTIWAQLLSLPNNCKQYNHFINHTTQPFDDIVKDFPLENKISLKNLKKVLCNLVTWAPFFSQVTYLPVFVFPFVKVFHNEPVLCFEAVCTIIINWCQHWFEYYPLPPLNILAMIENVILEHDPALIKHFTHNNITSKDYAWPLLETTFSETLTSKEWCKLWDHILTNEPAFFLLSIAAYNILNRDTLLGLKSIKDIDAFYHHQNLIDIKTLISKTYTLLNTTTANNHPRQYLNEFQTFKPGSYLSFNDFPKFQFDIDELQTLKEEQANIQNDEKAATYETEIVEKYTKHDIIKETESNRLAELEKVCRNKIKEERQRVADQRKRLLDLRKQLEQKEIDVLNESREKLVLQQSKQKQRMLETVLNDVEQSRTIEQIEAAKAESELIKHYSDLLLYKIQMEEMMHSNDYFTDTDSEYRVLKEQQRLLTDELNKIHTDSTPNDRLKQLNIVTSITAMDDLILRIETELMQQMADKSPDPSSQLTDRKVLHLESETKELELKVGQLLHTLGKLKIYENKSHLDNNGTRTIPSRSTEKSFKQLKKIIQESRNGNNNFASDEIHSLRNSIHDRNG